MVKIKCLTSYREDGNQRKTNKNIIKKQQKWQQKEQL